MRKHFTNCKVSIWYDLYRLLYSLFSCSLYTKERKDIQIGSITDYPQQGDEELCLWDHTVLGGSIGSAMDWLPCGLRQKII